MKSFFSQCVRLSVFVSPASSLRYVWQTQCICAYMNVVRWNFLLRRPRWSREQKTPRTLCYAHAHSTCELFLGGEAAVCEHRSRAQTSVEMLCAEREPRQVHSVRRREPGRLVAQRGKTGTPVSDSLACPVPDCPARRSIVVVLWRSGTH